LAKNKNLIYIGVGALIGATALFFVLRAVLVKYRVIRIAKREWEGWGKPLYNIKGEKVRGKSSLEEKGGFAQRVAKYWKEGTGKDRDGTDGVAWSSAFISYIMKKGGAGDKFVYNQAHSKYIRDSIANRKQGKFNAPFVGYRINEVAPKVGDLVCYHRQSGGIQGYYDRTSDYKSHCDLVVKKDKTQLEVIGGNVGDAVSKRIVSIDNNGIVNDRNKKWFAVIKTNI